MKPTKLSSTSMSGIHFSKLNIALSKLVVAVLVVTCVTLTSCNRAKDSVQTSEVDSAVVDDEYVIADSAVADTAVEESRIPEVREQKRYKMERRPEPPRMRREETTADIEEPENYFKIAVVYGTDRKPLNVEDPDQLYSGARDESLGPKDFHAGTLEVSIPKNHEKGNIEKPRIWNFFDRENPEKYMVVLGIDTIKEHAFDKLRELVAGSNAKDAFVFIHGFSNTFSDAAKRTAQLAFDIGFKGCPIMFSWPSNGETLEYISDYDNVQWAIPHLKSFLEKVIAEGKPQKLNLIAHSMGNVLLTNVLAEMQSQHQEILFNQIILAAPDIDASIFKNNIAPRMNHCAERITLYSSSNDKALKLSKKLRNYIRVGESGPNIFTLMGIETIDASPLADDGYFCFDLNHDYFASCEPVITDIFLLFHDNSPPDRRNLLLINQPSGNYWAFKK